MCNKVLKEHNVVVFALGGVLLFGTFHGKCIEGAFSRAKFICQIFARLCIRFSK